MKASEAWRALKSKLAGKGAFERSIPDDFPLDPASPQYASQILINGFYATLPEPRVAFAVKPAQHPTIRRILDGPDAERFAFLEAVIARRLWLEQNSKSKGSTPAVVCEFRDILRNVSLLLYRRVESCSAEQIQSLISPVAAVIAAADSRNFESDLPPLLKLCDMAKGGAFVPQGLRQALLDLDRSISTGWVGADRRRVKEKIHQIVGTDAQPKAATARRPQLLDRRDAWTQPFTEYLQGLNNEKGTAWDDLIRHARLATQSKPAGKWLKEAGRLLGAVGTDDFVARVIELFPTVRSSATTEQFGLLSQLPIQEDNATVLKGFVWCCSELNNEGVTRAVSELGQICYRKVPGWGPLCAKVGNACLFTLSQLPGLAPVSQLSRLRLKVKYSVALRLIERALEEAATKLGMSSEELEEIAVPTYGLEEGGCLREEFGDFTAHLQITGTHSTELTWIKSDGTSQKSVPSRVKEHCAEEFKEFKRIAQDVEKMLPAQRDRLERTLLSEREWEFEKWCDRYLNHPLMAHLVRRLIWHFRDRERSALAIWHEGKLVDVQERPLDWLGSATRVRLWHPLGFDVALVQAWREWLETHQVTQPFKQAHREIYVLTDAELRTATYSNRFAGHIIKQHQFSALARQRGWACTLQGNFDSHNTPTLSLPRWDIVAQFWVDAATGTDSTTDMGIFLYLSTDQVRFCDASGLARPLAEVPALVFSEVMRDVDLFVGVCSVANDPAWQDSGETGPYYGYGHRVGFGDLSTTARTRKEVLERLLPRLKIAGQCSLEAKFLVVRGRLRTYKIHLGSANILMSPNDQYLCIVADRSGSASRAGEKVFLPYEGDSTLSLILSKAFLLADDEKIKDPGIVSQIRR